MYTETRGEVVPLCKSKALAFDKPGCPIESIATDERIQTTIAKFEQAKLLVKLSQLPETQTRIFQEIGLLDDPLLHMQLEAIWFNKHKDSNAT